MMYNPPKLVKCIKEMQDKAKSYSQMDEYYSTMAIRNGNKESMELAKLQLAKSDTAKQILDEFITIVKINWPEPAVSNLDDKP